MAQKTSPNAGGEAGDDLLRKVVATFGRDGEFVNQLATAFCEGYPIEHLDGLLGSADPGVVSAGVWIASELGVKSHPLLRKIMALRGHPDARVRFFVLDVAMSCCDEEDVGAVADAVGMMDDPDEGVRWKVLEFLSVVSESVFAVAVNVVAAREPRSLRSAALFLLLDAAGSSVQSAIIAGLSDGDVIVRMYAVAVAARVAARDATGLRFAMRSVDNAISEFASDMAKRLQIVGN